MTNTPKILLYRGTGFIDTIIRWQTWGSVAHAALWVPANVTGNYIIEATASGVISRPLDNPFSEPAEVYDVPMMSESGWASAIIYAKKQIGKPYDFRGLFQFVARDGSDNPRAWFCSDLVFECVRQGGVLLVARVPRCKVSPEKLRESGLLVPSVLI